jgi:hypothetical protein
MNKSEIGDPLHLASKLEHHMLKFPDLTLRKTGNSSQGTDNQNRLDKRQEAIETMLAVTFLI